MIFLSPLIPPPPFFSPTSPPFLVAVGHLGRRNKDPTPLNPNPLSVYAGVSNVGCYNNNNNSYIALYPIHIYQLAALKTLIEETLDVI